MKKNIAAVAISEKVNFKSVLSITRDRDKRNIS